MFCSQSTFFRVKFPFLVQFLNRATTILFFKNAHELYTSINKTKIIVSRGRSDICTYFESLYFQRKPKPYIVMIVSPDPKPSHPLQPVALFLCCCGYHLVWSLLVKVKQTLNWNRGQNTNQRILTKLLPVEKAGNLEWRGDKANVLGFPAEVHSDLSVVRLLW